MELNKDKIKLELTEKQAAVVMQALEAFSRASMGQFKYALQEMFPHIPLNYADGEELEHLIRQRLNLIALEKGKDPYFPIESDTSWGIYQQDKCHNGSIAWPIYQALRQYLAVKRNDGYFDWSFVTYDDPADCGGEPAPTIEACVKYKDFPLYCIGEDRFNAFKANMRLMKRRHAWDMIDRDFPDLPKGDAKEIIPVKKQGIIVRYDIRIHKPQKPKDVSIQTTTEEKKQDAGTVVHQ